MNEFCFVVPCLATAPPIVVPSLAAAPPFNSNNTFQYEKKPFRTHVVIQSATCSLRVADKIHELVHSVARHLQQQDYKAVWSLARQEEKAEPDNSCSHGPQQYDWH
mmetsp:Transcript_126248/g.252185  ORF Transcript_126248/g.252185 Transcript_126248/m.252185 type:complete len:106 (+) Transcript_126248:2-319(+)